MSFSDNYYMQILRSARELYRDYQDHFDFNFGFVSHDQTAQSFYAISALVERLKDIEVMTEENELKLLLLDTAYSNLTELDFLAIDFVFSKAFNGLTFGASGPRTAGYALSLELALDKVMFKEPGSVEKFLHEAQRVLDYADNDGIKHWHFKLTRFSDKKLTVDQAEHTQNSVEELHRLYENIWVYGVINGCDWA